MYNPNYSIEIISHHPKFENKSLKKYNVDGIETVGAWGDEPFEIRFKNNTWQKVQVKLSLDGTDILTGDKANTEVSSDMWVVNGYGTLALKAWPETRNGGSRFVFTGAANSVAVHTHGDLSSRGIIAAAVYTEGHVEPFRLTFNGSFNSSDYYTNNRGLSGRRSRIGDVSKGGDLRSETICDSGASYSASLDCLDIAPAASKNLESLVAIGAGEHVTQKIVNVVGLIKPMLAETVRVKYLWWDDLVSKLKENNVAEPHPSGFPGDKTQSIMSIGNTPKVGSFKRSAPVDAPVYFRI